MSKQILHMEYLWSDLDHQGVFEHLNKHIMVFFSFNLASRHDWRIERTESGTGQR